MYSFPYSFIYFPIYLIFFSLNIISVIIRHTTQNFLFIFTLAFTVCVLDHIFTRSHPSIIIHTAPQHLSFLFSSLILHHSHPSSSLSPFTSFSPLSHLIHTPHIPVQCGVCVCGGRGGACGGAGGVLWCGGV